MVLHYHLYSLSKVSISSASSSLSGVDSHLLPFQTITPSESYLIYGSSLPLVISLGFIDISVVVINVCILLKLWYNTL